MYRPVPRRAFLEVLNHIRALDLSRENPTIEDRQRFARQNSLLAQFRSDDSATIKHPTLRTMHKVADAFLLDDVSVFRLYGYRLDRYFHYDLSFNGDRTHFVDPHLLPEDFRLTLIPELLVPVSSFSGRATMNGLVQKWNGNATFRRLASWRSSCVAYLYIGLEDSASWPEAAGGIAQVELISATEVSTLNPKSVYVVQFPNGYRCCRCERRGTKLILLSGNERFSGPREFDLASGVRIVGLVIAVFLPVRRGPAEVPGDLPTTEHGADGVLPWERLGAADLFQAKYRRFVFASNNRSEMKVKCEEIFGDYFSATTDRRFRDDLTVWQPHGHTTIYLSMFHYARFQDTLRAFSFERTHTRSYSLKQWMNAKQLSDLFTEEAPVEPPLPAESWEELNGMYAEYPGLVLSPVFSGAMSSGRIWRYTQEQRLTKLPLPVVKGAWVLTNRTMKRGTERESIIGAVIPVSGPSRRGKFSESD